MLFQEAKVSFIPRNSETESWNRLFCLKTPVTLPRNNGHNIL